MEVNAFLNALMETSEIRLQANALYAMQLARLAVDLT